MKFVNETPFPAHLFRTALDGNRMAAAATLRVTFDIGEPCSPSRLQPWIVSSAPWDGPQGPMEHDDIYDRGGCDIHVFGKARGESRAAVPQVDVVIEVGHFSYRVRVFGDRTWIRRDDQLVPSEPVPFMEMPVDLAHAFGGKTVYDELEVPFGSNPTGKGFYLEEEAAEGAPLPNVENPLALIQRWNDRPDPVGIAQCPMTFGPRLRRAIDVDENGRKRGRFRNIHNRAFPALVLASVENDAELAVSGMSAKPLRFALPPDRFIANTTIGEIRHVDPFRIDQIGIEMGDNPRFFITYRYTFTYVFRRGEPRRCELHWKRP
jgi:Uncharacterized protein conserved in bacteria (DUF2169)